MQHLEHNQKESIVSMLTYEVDRGRGFLHYMVKPLAEALVLHLVHDTPSCNNINALIK